MLLTRRTIYAHLGNALIVIVTVSEPRPLL